MQIRFAQEMNTKALIITEETVNNNGFREMMLKKNRISRLLNMQMRQRNLQTEYVYDVSLGQALSKLFERIKISGDEVIMIMRELANLVSELEEYLLDGEGILFNPEYIFLNGERNKVFFVYYPEWKQPFGEGITGLLQFLMDHIDYRDRSGVELIYLLYQTSIRDEVTVEEMMAAIREQLIAPIQELIPIHYGKVAESREVYEVREPAQILTEAKKPGKIKEKLFDWLLKH